MRPAPVLPCRRATGLLALLSALTLVAGLLVTVATPAPPASAAPKLRVTKVVGGLTNPWDLTWVGGTMLFDQRGGGVWSKQGGTAPRQVSLVGGPRIYAHGESGMMAIVADPHASSNRYFYTCMAVATASGKRASVQVWKWRLDSAARATKVQVLVKGIPLNASGRHSGCRLRFRSATSLYIGTGDAVGGTNPQNLNSLGGKILRIRSDGYVFPSNPFYSRGGNARYVWNYGHRNVQGLIKRPGRSELWSVEHGTRRDDEVNSVRKGKNYGWSPTPGYNESRSMTDKKRFKSSVGAKWRSGDPTVATSGGTFLSGSRWGSWNGRLAVAMLKGQGVKLFTVDQSNKITGSSTILRGYGRLRTAQQGPDGNLYLTTSNNSGDAIYRVTPR